MSPELDGGQAQPPRPSTFFNFDERELLAGWGHHLLLEERFDDPRFQIEQALEIAELDAERGEGGLIRKSLDIAVAIADHQREGLEAPEDAEYAPYPGLDAQVSSYAAIARAAHRLDQEPDYVRSILDKGLEAATAEAEPQETRARLQAVQLGILAEAAHTTNQDADYIIPMVDRIRDMELRTHRYSRAETTVDKRIKGLEHRIGLARRYGLGDDYVRRAIDEERDRWWVTAALSQQTLDAKVDELTRIAAIASSATWDRDYVHGIIEQGHHTARLGAGPEAYAKLVRAVHLNEKIGTDKYETDLLEEGFYQVVNMVSKGREPRDITGSINQLLHSMYGPRTDMKDHLLAKFVTYGIGLIRALDDDAIEGRPSRVRHQLLNTLLWDMTLPKDLMEANGIERRSLSYIFRPDSAGKPGKLSRPAVSSV